MMVEQAVVRANASAGMESRPSFHSAPSGGGGAGIGGAGGGRLGIRSESSRLKFHPETKLLIAVGDEAQLQAIDDILKSLRPDLDPRTAQPHSRSSKTNATPKATETIPGN
jgi:hypothetical protein